MENSKSLSEKLQDLIIHPKELAIKLANGDFNEPKPIAPVYPTVSKKKFKQTMNSYYKILEAKGIKRDSEKRLD